MAFSCLSRSLTTLSSPAISWRHCCSCLSETEEKNELSIQISLGELWIQVYHNVRDKPWPPVLSFLSSASRACSADLLLATFCLMLLCWFIRLQKCFHIRHNWHTYKCHIQISRNTHLSATATASGSVGGIMKHIPGALMVRPFASFTSHLGPLFLSRVYRSPRKIEPCVVQNKQSKLCFNLILQLKKHKFLK